jgi:hypothetical protein
MKLWRACPFAEMFFERTENPKNEFAVVEA